MHFFSDLSGQLLLPLLDPLQHLFLLGGEGVGGLAGCSGGRLHPPLADVPLAASVAVVGRAGSVPGLSWRSGSTEVIDTLLEEGGASARRGGGPVALTGACSLLLGTWGGAWEVTVVVRYRREKPLTLQLVQADQIKLPILLHKDSALLYPLPSSTALSSPAAFFPQGKL